MSSSGPSKQERLPSREQRESEAEVISFLCEHRLAHLWPILRDGGITEMRTFASLPQSELENRFQLEPQQATRLRDALVEWRARQHEQAEVCTFLRECELEHVWPILRDGGITGMRRLASLTRSELENRFRLDPRQAIRLRDALEEWQARERQRIDQVSQTPAVAPTQQMDESAAEAFEDMKAELGQLKKDMKDLVDRLRPMKSEIGKLEKAFFDLQANVMSSVREDTENIARSVCGEYLNDPNFAHAVVSLERMEALEVRIDRQLEERLEDRLRRHEEPLDLRLYEREHEIHVLGEQLGDRLIKIEEELLLAQHKNVMEMISLRDRNETLGDRLDATERETRFLREQLDSCVPKDQVEEYIKKEVSAQVEKLRKELREEFLQTPPRHGHAADSRNNESEEVAQLRSALEQTREDLLQVSHTLRSHTSLLDKAVAELRKEQESSRKKQTIYIKKTNKLKLQLDKILVVIASEKENRQDDDEDQEDPCPLELFDHSREEMLSPSPAPEEQLMDALEGVVVEGPTIPQPDGSLYPVYRPDPTEPGAENEPEHELTYQAEEEPGVESEDEGPHGSDQGEAEESCSESSGSGTSGAPGSAPSASSWNIVG